VLVIKLEPGLGGIRILHVRPPLTIGQRLQKVREKVDGLTEMLRETIYCILLCATGKSRESFHIK
jgi:hypothetical protein